MYYLCCSIVTTSQYNMYTDYVSERDILIVITMTTFPAWDAVAVGLAKGCTGVVVAAVVVVCDAVPGICIRFPLILITKHKIWNYCINFIF